MRKDLGRRARAACAGVCAVAGHAGLARCPAPIVQFIIRTRHHDMLRTINQV